MIQRKKGAGCGGSWSELLAVSGGILIIPLLPFVPVSFAWTLPCALATCSWRLGWPRPLILFLLATAWALFTAQMRIEDRLERRHAGQVLEVDGAVTSVPQELGDRLRFRFRPQGAEVLPRTILVNWYRDWPAVRAGQRWSLQLRLKPPWGNVNFLGPDMERWLFSQGIGAVATVRTGTRLAEPTRHEFPLQSLRENLKHAVSESLNVHRERAVVLALASADRSGLSRRDREILRVTGTAHLLAISGLHIGLAALGGGFLFRGLLVLVPLRRTGRWPHTLTLLAGLAAAAAYAMLANMGVSTVRAFLMVAAVVITVTLSRSVHPVRSFLLALAGVLLIDPLAPLGSGFWFSFMAVFALLSVFQSIPGRLPWWKTLCLAQAAVFLFLLPANAVWLGGFSPLALVANLLAIPWVSFMVVPPILAGIVVLPLFEPLAAASWSLAGYAAVLLFSLLEALAGLQPFLRGLAPLGPAGLLLAASGAWLLFLPRAVGMRLPGLSLLLPLFLPVSSGIGEGDLQVDALDVGQGTAVVLRTQHHAVLYDTGPGDNAGSDFMASAVFPLFDVPGAPRPGRVVLSHGDLDHSGGLYSLRNRYPGIGVMGSAQDARFGVERCHAGMSWWMDGFEFRSLHPSTGLPYLRNNSSCVLSVQGRNPAGKPDILLSGDIDSSIERRLLLNGLAQHDLVMVPHHGSASSSSEGFIEAVDPRAAIAPAGLGNRFGFPRDSVRDRYGARGIPFWSTGECGGLRVMLHADGRVTAASARRLRQRIWRWPASSDCP